MKSTELLESLETIKLNKKFKTDKVFVDDIGISYMTYYRWRGQKKLKMSPMARKVIRRYIRRNKEYLNA